MSKFDINVIKDPTMFKVNVLPAHADFIPYSSVKELEEHSADAKDRVCYDTSLRMSLNGIWKFSYS